MASTPLRVATPKSPSARGSPSSSSPSQRSRTTLGPFSPGVSKSRSLAAIEKTMREMNLYASRSMPHGNEADDRSVLTGVRVMMRAARLMEANAAANMNRIKEQKRGNDGDPRAAMREQLNRARREAADAARQLEGHEHALQDHCDKLQDEYGRLVEIQEAFSGAVESSSFASTPSAGAASRSPGKSPGSGGGGFSRPSSALSSPGTPSRAPWTASEDAALLEQVRRSGFSWAVVAGAIPARTASLCKDRWEQLVDEACRRARERQHAMSKVRSTPALTIEPSSSLPAGRLRAPLALTRSRPRALSPSRPLATRVAGEQRRGGVPARGGLDDHALALQGAGGDQAPRRAAARAR